MSPHVTETCNEGNGVWLPLIEYSVKSGVSLSTIRRKIKSNSIRYRLEKGRYLIHFSDEGSATDLGNWKDEPLVKTQLEAPKPKKDAAALVSDVSDDEFETLPFAEKAVKLVSDAFEHAIREKEEHIRTLERLNRELEDQLSELRLLVKVLEEKYDVRY